MYNVTAWRVYTYYQECMINLAMFFQVMTLSTQIMDHSTTKSGSMDNHRGKQPPDSCANQAMNNGLQLGTLSIIHRD